MDRPTWLLSLRDAALTAVIVMMTFGIVWTVAEQIETYLVAYPVLAVVVLGASVVANRRAAVMLGGFLAIFGQYVWFVTWLNAYTHGGFN